MPVLIAGVLNLTPDSFSDGGRFASIDSAVAAALVMAGQGADWIDVGGESTRPLAEPVTEADVRDSIQESFDWQYQFNPAWQDPEMRAMMDDVLDEIVPMVLDVASVQAPLPQAFGGFFQSLGAWLSGALAAVGGWLLYGALVLIVVHWLGGAARLPEFLGTVALYSVPGLLGLLGPIPCVGFVLALVGFIWGIVVYIKATSVATGLDGGRATVAVLAPVCRTWTVKVTRSPRLWVIGLAVLAIARTGSTTVIGTP